MISKSAVFIGLQRAFHTPVHLLLLPLMRWILAYEPLAARLNRSLMIIWPGLHARLRGMAVAQGLKTNSTRPAVSLADEMPEDGVHDLLGPCARNIYRQLQAARKAAACTETPLKMTCA